MSPAEHTAERVYARPPHFSVHYRAGRRLRWSSEARADYSALLLLEGELRWRESKSDPETAPDSALNDAAVASGELRGGSALLAAPGDSLQASCAGRAEFVVVNFSPVFVHDAAARAHLTRPEGVVTFRARSVESDQRLSRLARDLADELLEEAAGQGD